MRVAARRRHIWHYPAKVFFARGIGLHLRDVLPGLEGVVGRLCFSANLRAANVAMTGKVVNELVDVHLKL